MSEEKPDNTYVTKAEADHIADRAADRAAKQAVSQMCDRIGVDPDSRNSIEDTRDVIRWARQARDGQQQLKESARRGAAKAAASTMTLGALYLVWWLITAFSKTKGIP